MKVLFKSFAVFIRQIRQDDMLIAVCFAPVLTGLLFRFGVPFAEGLLTAQGTEPAVLAPYYLLFDLFLCIVTPYIFCFVSALVMLTEYDENMASYLAVTPVGKRGYIISRLVFPAVLSLAASVVFTAIFALTVWNVPMLLAASVLSCLQSVAVSLLLFAFSHNRVEGMALGKLSGLYLLGLFVPFFLDSWAQYLFAPLPSYWMAMMCAHADWLLLFPALITSVLWIWALYRRFERKLS